MSLSVTVAIAVSLCLFDGAEGEAAHELTLAEPSENEDGGDRNGRGGRQLRPEQAFRRRERSDERGERRRVRAGKVETPERLVPAQDDREQSGRRDPGQRQRH